MDAASIEQMNKIRLSLGMAPLPVPGGGPQFKAGAKDEYSDSEASDDLSTLDKRQALAGGNWQKLEAERQEKIDRQKRKDAAKKTRDATARFARLDGKGLGDDEEGTSAPVDTRTWLLQQKKRQKKIEKARKLEEELAAREREVQADYTSKDLAGVKVGHQVDEFDDVTGEQILTLKDADIGDESGDDELENEELRAKEKLNEKLQAKKKKPDYDPTEQGEKKGLLSKYDDETEKTGMRRFTLDGQGSTAEAQRRRLDDDAEVRSKGVKINLDMFQDDTPASDYRDPDKVKVKKPKKHKEKKTRQKAIDDEDILSIVEPTFTSQPEEGAMDVDGVQTNGKGIAASKKRAYEFDDDDLQAKLSEQRRQALKKRKKTDGAELARQMREEMPVDDDELEGGLTIDETTEFVANLKKPEAPEEGQQNSRMLQRGTAASPGTGDEDEGEDEDGDTTMANHSYAEISDEAELKHNLKRETSTPTEPRTTGLDDEEQMTGSGLAASLNLLRKRGLVSTTDSSDLTDKDRARTRFLASKQHLIDDFDLRAREQREAERQSGRWERMSGRERDNFSRQQNEAREQYLARLQADMFNAQYRPDVKLQYHDEYGRSMNQKEAFKHLSHMFHGKGSGKQKTEKRLKKVEDERRAAEKGVLSLGGQGGFVDVQGREGKRTKMAGVRLQ